MCSLWLVWCRSDDHDVLLQRDGHGLVAADRTVHHTFLYLEFVVGVLGWDCGGRKGSDGGQFEGREGQED